jgi:RND family efflux transporter MFP subunit
MKRVLAVVLPLIIVAAGALGAWAMYVNRSQPETREPEAIVPLVRVQDVVLRDLEISVWSQGTVSPRTESVLVPEVAGRIIEVSQSFVSGGFFEVDDVLLRIDPHDYNQAVVQARARVTQAELRLAQEEAEADVAAEEWEEIGEGEATPLTLHLPQLADARAALEGARAELEKARRNQARTEIRAPYVGRVRVKNVDVGQYVGPGTPLATIYAVDFAEVRLPLPDRQLAFLDLPLIYRGDEERGQGPRVILRSEFAGRTFQWQGRIVRTEGEIDRRSRMVHAVAQVADPYARGEEEGRPPLAAGMFVEAEILGETVENAAVLPRSVLRSDGRVLIVDDESRLRFREVEVLQTREDQVIIGKGLESGERVCLSPLAVVTDGMRVRTGDGSRPGESG